MAKLFFDEISPNEIPTVQSVNVSTNRESTMTKTEDLHLHILMEKVTSNFENLLEDFFTQWGITTSRFAILDMLYHSNEGLTPTETAKRVGVTNATISAILSGLKDAGLIQSVQNAGDSRSYRVKLTESGAALLDKIYPMYHENVAKVWSHFDTHEKTQLNNLLTRYSQIMGVLGTKF